MRGIHCHSISGLRVTESCRAKECEWSVKRPMNFPRSSFAIATRNRDIYALGGNYGVERREHCSLECYDVVLASWRVYYIAMDRPRWGVKAAVVNDKLYVLGGDKKKTVSVQNFYSNSEEWIELSRYPSFGVTYAHLMSCHSEKSCTS